MAATYSRMTRRGQVTVPARVRAALGLNEGDRVEFELVEDGRVQASIRRAESVVERTKGILSVPGAAVASEEEMRESFGDYLATRFEGRRRTGG